MKILNPTLSLLSSETPLPPILFSGLMDRVQCNSGLLARSLDRHGARKHRQLQALFAQYYDFLISTQGLSLLCQLVTLASCTQPSSALLP